ncbi:MAG: Electron transport complex subunit RsxB [Candidatus Heimdallarchaeota archaeon LC_2]|nr:MAG: Electron transport complex subunit RsxB [Candidatus Heimdallarchaeota archaeon LC_2]
MCEYCSKHGSGKKWYLHTKNYIKNYDSTDHKRKEFTTDFIQHFMNSYKHYLQTGDIKRIMDNDDPNWVQRQFYNWYFKKKHSGQVVPFEEAKMIMELAGQISLVPCVCRMANSGEKKNLCMLFMAVPDDFWGADYIKRSEVEHLDIDDAQHRINEFYDQGLVQTVWTFNSPHIGAICNCDYPYCTAVRFRKHVNSVKSLLRSEYYAEIDYNTCTNCRKCIRDCQFGAMSYSTSTNKVVINEIQCFGCGVCRKDCKSDSIKLFPRENNDKIKAIW